MTKTATSKTTPSESTIQPPFGQNIEQRFNELAARYRALDAKTELLQKEVEELKANALPAKNWQAVVVDKGGQLLIVANQKDPNGDGYISQAEAIQAANDFITARNLKNSYKASALPTW